MSFFSFEFFSCDFFPRFFPPKPTESVLVASNKVVYRLPGGLVLGPKALISRRSVSYPTDLADVASLSLDLP